MSEQKGYFGSNSASLLAILHRYAAIINLFSEFNPKIEFKQLPKEYSAELIKEDYLYSEQRERLLFLYSADVITEKCLFKLLDSEAELTAALVELEDILIDEPKAVDKDIVGDALLMCSSFNCAESKFSSISFKAAFELANICASSASVELDDKLISFDGNVIIYNKELTYWLYDIGEPLVKYQGGFVDVKEKDTEMFLKDVRKLPFILNYYKKLYGKEFIAEVFHKGEFDPSVTDLERGKEYNEFLSAVKLKFDITGYLRKRNICDLCNIVDYRQNIIVDGKLVDSKMTADNNYKCTVQLSVKDVSTKSGEPLSDKEIFDIALARYKTNCLMDNENVVAEVWNNGKKHLFSYKNGEFEEVNIDTFETVPFNFNKVWTYVQEASRDNNISVNEGKLVIKMADTDKKYEMTADEMVYAERMIKDQRSRQRSASPILTKLSELIKGAQEKKNSEGKGQAGGKSAAPNMQDHKTSDKV